MIEIKIIIDKTDSESVKQIYGEWPQLYGKWFSIIVNVEPQDYIVNVSILPGFGETPIDAVLDLIIKCVLVQEKARLEVK